MHSNQVIEDVHIVTSVPKGTRRDSSELVSSGVGEPEAGRRCFTRYSWRSWTSIDRATIRNLLVSGLRRKVTLYPLRHLEATGLFSRGGA